MKLHKGQEAEYKKRHDQIWPELSDLLRKTGIKNYSIFLDRTTGTLFAVHDIDQPDHLLQLKTEIIMKKWWAYMRDIMYTHEDNSPKTSPLELVFHMD